MSQYASAGSGERRFDIGRVLWCILRGAPFFWKDKGVPWHMVRVPRFPVAFSLLSGVFWTVMTELKAMEVVQEPMSTGKFAFSLIIGSVVNGAFCVALNGIIMLGFWSVLTQFKNHARENRGACLVAGAQRVSYFSTPFQSVFFFFLMAAGPFLARTYAGPSAWVEATLSVGLIAFGIIRLVAVFQSMRYETDGSILAGLFALVFCLDLWGTFIPISLGYIW